MCKVVSENKNVEKVVPQGSKENQSEKGASMVEYALLAALISVVAITALTTLGTKISTNFSTTASSL